MLPDLIQTQTKISLANTITACLIEKDIEFLINIDEDEDYTIEAFINHNRLIFILTDKEHVWFTIFKTETIEESSFQYITAENQIPDVIDIFQNKINDTYESNVLVVVVQE